MNGSEGRVEEAKKKRKRRRNEKKMRDEGSERVRDFA